MGYLGEAVDAVNSKRYSLTEGVARYGSDGSPELPGAAASCRRTRLVDLGRKTSSKNIKVVRKNETRTKVQARGCEINSARRYLENTVAKMADGGGDLSSPVAI